MTIDTKQYEAYVKMAHCKPAEERDRLIQKLRLALARKEVLIHVHPV
jgi:hypothetical protein